MRFVAQQCHFATHAKKSFRHWHIHAWFRAIGAGADRLIDFEKIAICVNSDNRFAAADPISGNSVPAFPVGPRVSLLVTVSSFD